MLRVLKACVLVVAGMSIAFPAGAASWPKIPSSEWDRSSVPDHPNAPAVVLLERGRLVLNASSLSSFLEVYRRVKVLTEEGVDFGSVSLFSNDAFRMKGLEARTHRPDRSVVKLPKDAVFRREFSEYYNRSMTSFAMPEVTVGSIVEYRYKVYFDSVLYPRPWYFQSRIPVLYSEMECVVPRNYRFYPDAVRTMRSHEMEPEIERTAQGIKATYRMENLPPIPDEPFRYAFADLACRVTFLPVAYTGSYRTQLFETWESTVKLVQGTGDYGYSGFRSGARQVKSKARQLTGTAVSARERAERVYRFVRDDVVTEDYTNVWAGENTGNDVLKNGRGDYAEKALLLQVMLGAVGITSSIGWTNPADVKHINRAVPNTAEFNAVIVVAEVDGERVFLDPTDRTLGFGMLRPELEGVDCLLVDNKEPTWIKTPESPAEDSGQHARLDVNLDAEGRVTGHGRMALRGHEAWRRLRWKETRKETVDAWQKWLEDEFSGYDIDEVSVDESVTDRTVTLGWRMAQREEEVLGDEVTLTPSEPLAVESNPFALEPSRRLTPVHLEFMSSDTVEMSMTWPDGWTVDVLPDDREYTCLAGRLELKSEIHEGGRGLTVTRLLKITKRDFFGFDEYRILRNLLIAAIAADASTVTLILE